MSAFVGGWTAANFSPAFTPESRATHALMACGLATLIVVGAAGLASSSSLATRLMGPTATTMAYYQRASEPRLQTTGQAARAGPAQPGAGDDRNLRRVNRRGRRCRRRR